MAELEARIGPVQIRVEPDNPWAKNLEAHLREFIIKEDQGLSADIIFGGRGPRSEHMHRVEGLHKEVAVWLDSRSEWNTSANNRLTVRSALRLVKRFPNFANWTHSRWLLFLRYGFEMPLLAVLENEHGFIPIHGATLIGEGGAVLLIGENGAGKSTLACAAASQLGLELGSDNFTPYDGERVLGFPGPPKSKPGETLPPYRPISGSWPLKAVVMVGFPASRLGAEPREQIWSYLRENDEAHHGTGWEDAFPLESVSDHVNRVARLSYKLGALPTLEYAWQSQSESSAISFIGEHCAN